MRTCLNACLYQYSKRTTSRWNQDECALAVRLHALEIKAESIDPHAAAPRAGPSGASAVILTLS